MRIELNFKVVNDDGTDFQSGGIVYNNIPRAVFHVIEKDVLDVLAKWNGYDAANQAAKKSG